MNDTLEDIVVDEDGLARPAWAATESLMRDYYDHEWGEPITDERGCYERLCLEGFQAGLSWRTVLAKRAALRERFAFFDPEQVARFTEADRERIATDPRVIRSPRKIAAMVSNAQVTLALRERAAHIRKQGGEQIKDSEDSRLLGFSLPTGQVIDDGLPALIWSYQPTQTPLPETLADIPVSSPESTALAKALKKVGYTFIGPVSAYALMEASGLLDTNLLGAAKRGKTGLFAGDGKRVF